MGDLITEANRHAEATEAKRQAADSVLAGLSGLAVLIRELTAQQTRIADALDVLATPLRKQLEQERVNKAREELNEQKRKRCASRELLAAQENLSRVLALRAGGGEKAAAFIEEVIARYTCAVMAMTLVNARALGRGRT